MAAADMHVVREKSGEEVRLLNLLHCHWPMIWFVRK